MKAIEQRSNFQQWMDLVRSLEGRFESGSEEEMDEAQSLLKTISPYTEDWKERYALWHGKTTPLEEKTLQ